MSNNLLISILNNVNFVERYRSLYESHQSENPLKTVPPEEATSILKDLGVNASYNKRERFFAIKEKVDSYTVQLNIAFPYGLAEFVLFIENKEKGIKGGGPFGSLLKQLEPKVEKTRKISFSDLKELREVLKEVLAIFNDVKNEIARQERA